MNTRIAKKITRNAFIRGVHIPGYSDFLDIPVDAPTWAMERSYNTYKKRMSYNIQQADRAGRIFARAILRNSHMREHYKNKESLLLHLNALHVRRFPYVDNQYKISILDDARIFDLLYVMFT